MAKRENEERAWAIREKLDQIEKQKAKAKAKEEKELALAREAARKKAAEEAEKAARPRKVFVCGDVRGNIQKLFTTVEAQIAKVGAFDMLLGVGCFMPDADAVVGSVSAYLNGEKKVPLDSYFIDASAALVQASPRGRQLCDRLHFLGGYGVRDINGLRVAFLSGRYNPAAYEVDDVDFVGDAFTRRAVSELQRLVLQDRKQRGVDILLSCGWPAELDVHVEDDASRPAELEDGPSWKLACAKPLAELCCAIEPRYHLFGTADIFYQRPPFQMHRQEHICRCIGLGKVGSTSKQRKWLHALSLSPMKHMKQEDLKQKPPNTTACPFVAGQKRPASDSACEEPAKRRAVQQEDGLSERAVAAFLAGDRAAYEDAHAKLQAGVVVCGSAMPEAAPAKRAMPASSSSTAKPAADAKTPEPVKTGSVGGASASTSSGAAEAAAKEEPRELEKDLSPEELARKQAAKDWLQKPPEKGIVRYTFEAAGPLGVRLSRDVPPWILEVRDGTLAAKKAPRVPVGGIVLAVNGYDVSTKENAKAIEGLGKRPVILDIEWPIDQGTPVVKNA